MKTIKLTLAVVLASVGLSTAAYAQDTTTRSTQTTTTTARTDAAGAQKGDRATYRAAKKQADADYKAAKARCDAIGTGSIGKENCIGIARAEQNMKKAQAKAQYKPDDKSMRDAKIAAAHLDYANAKAKCESMGGNVKETGNEASMCMAKANEARNQALAAAKATTVKGAPAGTDTATKARSATGDTRGDIGREK